MKKKHIDIKINETDYNYLVNMKRKRSWSDFMLDMGRKEREYGTAVKKEATELMLKYINGIADTPLKRSKMIEWMEEAEKKGVIASGSSKRC